MFIYIEQFCGKLIKKAAIIDKAVCTLATAAVSADVLLNNDGKTFSGFSAWTDQYL